MTATRRHGATLFAEAGKVMDAWVLEALRLGLGGVECLSGIPGTLGGALYMNAGAYGHEISDHVVSVTVLTAASSRRTCPRPNAASATVQASALRETVILAATWALPEADPAPLLAARKDILAKRKEKQPWNFRRPAACSSAPRSLRLPTHRPGRPQGRARRRGPGFGKTRRLHRQCRRRHLPGRAGLGRTLPRDRARTLWSRT